MVKLWGRETEEDWKELLSDEAKQNLISVLNTTKQHKNAYFNADDVKVAQLWTAVAEMHKRLNSIDSRVGNVEEPFRVVVAIGNVEKKKAIERLVSEIFKSANSDNKEIINRLVESLMKY